MKIQPEVHLEDWKILELEDYNSYEKGKLRVIENKNDKKLILQIRSTENHFFTVKEIYDYFELMQYDTYLNKDINNEEDFYSTLSEYLMHIRESFELPEYIVFNKQTNQIFTTSGLFHSEGWGDETLGEMWNKNEIEVIEILDDIYPNILTKDGWVKINYKIPMGSKDENRQKNLNDLV